MSKFSSVCIIDDDPIYTFVFGDMLKSLKIAEEITVYDNGMQAILRLKERNTRVDEKLPEVLFVDLDMPIMDGFQFLEEFQEVEWKTPIQVFVISSTIDQSEIKKVNKYEAVSKFMSKPLNEQMILDLDIFSAIKLKN